MTKPKDSLPVPRSDEAQASSTAPEKPSLPSLPSVEETEPKPPALDRAKATALTPPRRHNPTGKTVAWSHAGHYYTATGVPVAKATETDLAPPPNPKSEIQNPKSK